MNSNSIKVPHDHFLIEWVESGRKEVYFAVSEVGPYASLSGGIIHTTDDDGRILALREIFLYFVKMEYAKLNSNVNNIAIYELTDKGRQHANYAKERIPHIMKK